MNDTATHEFDGALAPSKDKTIKLRIVYNGLEHRLEDVHETETIGAVLAAAIGLFTITDPQHLLALFRESDGLELTNEAQTVEAADLKNNERLVLRPSAVKGG